MSRSDRSRSGADAPAVVVECDGETVEAADRVQHVDQLPPGDRQAFLDVVDGTGRALDATELRPGDVVRYTEYYCVI
ncbi:hypothetical protein [Halobellus sp. EA9]|uniref:hypothetical protein n=1 Tax=Halobellus sp. EA9 TaxID=3421647 RepID=UPI003EBFCF2B